MKKDWQLKSLNEICDFKNGLWKGKKPPFIKVGVIRNTNFTKKCQLDDSNIAYIDVEVSKFQSRKLEYGDIILERSGGGPKQPVGRVVKFEKRENGGYSFSNFTSVIRIRDKEVVDFSFLYYFLYFFYRNGGTEKLQSRSTGIRNLRFKEYKQINIPIPPLPEQRRIVTLLDQAFEAIDKARENTQRNLENIRELFQSSLENVFIREGGLWNEMNLGDVCIIKPPKSEVRTRFINSDLVSFIPMKDLGICQKNFNANQTRSLDDVFGNYTYFAEEDVLLAKITPCFENGKLGIARRLTNGIGFGSSEYIVFRTDNLLFNEYLFYFLSREKFRKEGVQNMSGAVGHKRVAKSFINNYKISLPPFPEQQRIVTKIDAFHVESNKLEANYQQKLTDLDELRQSLLHKAFAGELVPRENVDILV